MAGPAPGVREPFRTSNRTAALPAGRPSRTARGLTWAAIVAMAGCGKPFALGEANSLIVVASDSVWAQVSEATYAILERTVFTTRDEKIFNVTQVGTESAELPQLLLWRQVLVFGPPGDERLARVARKAGREPAPGEIFQATDVWAHGQVVTGIVLEPGREVDSWLERLPPLSDLLEQSFRDYVMNRMFVSGVDTATASFLRETYGVTLEVPRVYERIRREGDIVILRNDNPEPSELIRSVLIQRLDPVDSLAAADVYAWRESMDDTQYNVPQSFQPLPERERIVELGDREAVEVRGIWQDQGGYPAAGPFIGVGVLCPSGTFFLDAWLYSPNPRRSKWEYLMQLERIVESFRCVENGSTS